jgi:hypothetical protein
VLLSGVILLHYFEKKEQEVCAVGVLIVLILEFSARNLSRFLDDVHIVEALNEPVGDSGSDRAKLFVNMGKVLCTDFFFSKFSLFLNTFLYASPQE